MNITDQDSSSRFLNRCKTDPLITFQMIEKIGKGNCSEVYKALNKITDRLVTIKIFPLNSSSPSEDDISFLKKLDHPFIDRITDIYTENQQIWLVSDYYQLGSIHDILTMTKQPLSEPEVSCVCYSVLYALDYIHALNKVHRGVKTSNILLNALGQVKLTDFDSAMWQDLETKEGENSEYCEDIWALGQCAIEMVEGVLTIDKQQNQPIIKNKLPKASYSRELRDFIEQCLQDDPKKRPRPSILFNHPFICKYKAELPNIRKRLVNERMEKITEYKKNIIRSSRSQTQKMIYNNVTGDENVPDESDFPSNTVDEIAQKLNNNTIEMALENENCVSFIERPSFNFTDLPSHIEPTNRNLLYNNMGPNFEVQEPISHIHHVRYDDSQFFEITPRIDQLSIISESDKIEFTTEKKDSRVPPLKLGVTVPVHRGRMPTIDSRYSSENTQPKSKENREMLTKPPTSKSGAPRTSASRPKMYKATNASNFVVKHKISETAMDNHLNYSADTEITLNPITVDRQKIADSSSTIPMDEVENYTINIPRISNKELKELTVSTVADSKGSSCFKSVFHTPHPSDSRKSMVLKVVKENLEQGSLMNTIESPIKKNGADVEAERRKLEKQMERELAEIKKKYGSMINGLGRMKE